MDIFGNFTMNAINVVIYSPLFFFCTFFSLQKTDTPLSHIASTQSTAIGTSSVAPSTPSSAAPTSTSAAPLSSSSQSHSTARDEIYIDDESLEGSGGRGEVSFTADHTIAQTPWLFISSDDKNKLFRKPTCAAHTFAAL